MDDCSRERMPGDAEAAGAVEAMREELSGWAAGDRLTFLDPESGITQPTAARVIRVLHDGFLIVECDDGLPSFEGFVVHQSTVVERLA
jgi:hypothetical protein